MNKTSFYDQFVHRHIGVSATELQEMLKSIGLSTLDQLIEETIPDNIRLEKEQDLPEALTEFEFLRMLKEVSFQNKVFKSYIGMGYSDTITPSVLLRNIFQNPGWYTQYTPYQAEISQGRLEALLNFQTMVSDFTGLPIANASLLDEGTAAAEAMTMFFGLKNKRNRDHSINEFLVSDNVLPQTIDILHTRAQPLGIVVKVQNWQSFEFTENTFGILLQYPGADGKVENYRPLLEKAKARNIFVTVAADILSLALLTPPGEWGADAVVGNTQRFGVPMGYGGPHAAYFATKEEFKRQIPGRIIGVSVDSQENLALRMALQTREQHIRREKATSNICTAQALLAIMASMYAVYHGSKGIKAIAERVHGLAQRLDRALRGAGFKQQNEHYFDTLSLDLSPTEIEKIRNNALANKINFYYTDHSIQISLDETTTQEDIEQILNVFKADKRSSIAPSANGTNAPSLPKELIRKSNFLTHPIFNSFHTETNMMRYIKRLENRDLSLTHSMIPLGSCTMKLNAATQLIPVSWEAFAHIHPFAPLDQTQGYQRIFQELEHYLSEITGFAACSLQPNSGAQGEFTGLLTIRAYHNAQGNPQRNIALIPSSAHGTNPASAVMAGMQVVVVKCDDHGNIDLEDLQAKAAEHQENLAALMVTYPTYIVP